MTGFELRPLGHYSLAASTRFLEGFAPSGVRPATDDRLRLAFPLEPSWQAVAISLWQDGPIVRGQYVGDHAPDAVRAHVARLLSADIDGRGFAAVGRRDRVVAPLQRRYPGLRPVGFWSAYEAAAWAVLSQRVRIVQAARMKEDLARRFGEVLRIDGAELAAFPAPQRLLERSVLAHLPEIKSGRLRAIAQAALDGRLDTERLRTAEPEAAITELQHIPGIGPFSAELILIRGAMAPDVFPTAEGRLHGAMRTAYELPESAGLKQLQRIADRWRPFRSWVALLFRTAREDDTHEIGGRAQGSGT